MKSTTISSQSSPSVVTLTQNVAGVATPIFVATVPDGAAYTIPNVHVIDGEAVNGAMFVMDIRNAGGNRITDGRVLIGYQAPSAEFPTFVRAIPLTNWAYVTTAEQKNAKYRKSIVQGADLNVGPYLKIIKRGKLIIALESAEQVVWANGNSYLETVVDEENGAL